MKKVLIVLLSVLLILSFTSCKKDKSEEVIAAYEEFTSAYKICTKTNSLISGIDFTIKDNSVNDGNLLTLLEAINGSDSDLKILSNKIKSGESTTSEDGNTQTFTNVVIEYKYTEGSDTTEKTGTLSISGTRVAKYTMRATASDTDVTYDLTINGKNYKISYYLTYNDGYSSASVNGTSVDVRLLNAKKSSGWG